MTLLAIEIFFLGLLVIFGSAYFYIIWDCERKNFKEVVEISIANDELFLQILRIISTWACDRGFDITELQEILKKYEENSNKIKKHKL